MKKSVIAGIAIGALIIFALHGYLWTFNEGFANYVWNTVVIPLVMIAAAAFVIYCVFTCKK